LPASLGQEWRPATDLNNVRNIDLVLRLSNDGRHIRLDLPNEYMMDWGEPVLDSSMLFQIDSPLC
jgi:hypothetical protein